MPAITWPAQLPQFPDLGARAATVDTRVRTQTDSGIIKTRQQVTTPPRIYTCELHMTGAQVDVFNTFFANTKYGALSFEWTDPETGADAPVTKTLEFESMPEKENIVGAATRAKEEWLVRLALRIVVE